MSEVVQAGGGMMRRTGPAGEMQVAVVHRPKYDDWSFPKGKLDRGETHEEAALREVEEETGFRCELGRELASTSYTDPRGRPKLVRYWEMRPVEGRFEPNAEVDELRWLSPEDALELLTNDHDRGLLRSTSSGHDLEVS